MWCAALAAVLTATTGAGGARAGAGAGGARVAGAVRLGALFAVHGAPAGAGGRCGPVREHYGIQRVEATLQALARIAADPALLPGLALGAELRDSCWAPPTALRQTIDLVRDAIAAPPPPLSPRLTSVPYIKTKKTCSEDLEEGEGAPEAPLVGVLGPGASSAAAQVQNLLQLFSIPQVSYSATSRELSDRARFSTFFRVVPSDLHQARLLVALLRAHNWTYVHALHTDESYGQSGMAALREEAARGGVCIARSEPLRAQPAAAEVDAALARLAAHEPRVQVAVCWCEGRTARAVLAGLARRGGGSALRLLGSDGWADRRDVVAGLERDARGSLTLRIRSPYLHDFDKHYHNLTPANNQYNPWFHEFWEQKFNCTLSPNPFQHERPCSGTESLAEDYTQEPKLALVVRGVYALAHALHDMRAALCPAPAPAALAPALCAAMLPFNVSLYQHFLSRVNFRAPDGGRVAFDENGDPPPELSEYDVMQWGGSASRGWRYVRVARWRGGSLHLAGGAAAAARRSQRHRAVCAAPCGAGQVPRAAAGERARCCWSCEPCPPLAVTRSPPAAGCRLCPPGARPDISRTVCLPSSVEWGGDERVARLARWAAGCAGGAGLSASCALGATLWRYRATPVVRAGSRELCALLLGAGALVHAAALAATARPAPWPCAAQRLAAPALAGVYAAVLARTLRIVRLVAAAQRARRPALLSSRSQVIVWAGLTTPGVAVSAWSAWQWGAGPRLLHPGRARSVLACSGEGAAAQLPPLMPALVLLGAAAALAARARRLPRRYDETRPAGAAVYATAVLWAAFFPLYAASEARSATLCACASLCALACQALSLGPRAYVALCRPELNTRARFLTASIRCHVGKYRAEAAPARRERATQTEPLDEEGRCAGGAVCAAAGACARVTQREARGGGGELLVHIALLRHHHVLPRGYHHDM